MATTYDQYIASLAPVGWWKLSDAVGSLTAVDSSGNGYAGSVTNVTFGQTGPIASSAAESGASFPGIAGDNVAVGNTVPELELSTNFSAAAFVKTSASTTTQRILIVGNYYAIHLATGTLELVDCSGNGASTAQLLDDGKWHLVVATMGSTASTADITLYIDGVKQTAAQFGTWNPTKAESYTYVGGDSNSNPFHGDIAQVMAFNKVLTPNQVAAIWTFSQSISTFDQYVSSLGPAAWWKLADAAGSLTAADSSGNGTAIAVHGSVTFGEPGQVVGAAVDTAAGFDGSTGYLNGTAASPLVGTNSVSVALFYNSPLTSTTRTPSPQAPTGFSYGSGGPNTSGSAGIVVFNGTTIIVSDGTTEASIGIPPLTANVTHMLTVVLDRTAATLALYVDGKFYASESAAGVTGAIDGAQHIWIGNTEGWYAKGNSSHAQLYNYALSAQQVQALWVYSQSVNAFDNYVANLKPLGWWKLADPAGSASAADSSGNGYTLTPQGGVTFGEPGLVVGSKETSAAFDGGYAEGATVLSGVAGAFSLVAIYDAEGNAWPTGVNQFQMLVTPSAGMVTYLGFNSGKPIISGSFSGQQYNIASPNVAPNTGVHMLVGVWDGGANLLLYLDGKLVATNPKVTGSLTAFSGAPVVGAYGASGSYPFVGQVQHAAVINYALSASQIAALWGYSQAMLSFDNYVAGLNPVGWWKANEQAGATEFADSSSYNNPAAINAPTTWTYGQTGMVLGSPSETSIEAPQGSYARPPNASQYNFGTNSFSAAFMIRGSATPAGYGGQISRGSTDSVHQGWGILLFPGGNNASFIYCDGVAAAAHAYGANGTDLFDGKNHLVVGVVDRSAETLTIYVDGVAGPAASISGIGSADVSTYLNLFINNTTVAFNVSQAMVFNYALSASQAANLATYANTYFAFPVSTTASASVSANGLLELFGNAGLAASAQLSASGLLELFGKAAMSADAYLSADGQNIYVPGYGEVSYEFAKALIAAQSPTGEISFMFPTGVATQKT